MSLISCHFISAAGDSSNTQLKTTELRLLAKNRSRRLPNAALRLCGVRVGEMIGGHDSKGGVSFNKQRADSAGIAATMMPMKAKPKATPHKLGANQKEAAVKARKHDPNFKQSRDICEDRSQRQMKTTDATRTRHAR